MPGAPDPVYVLARRVLLDALQALDEQRSAVVLVGAQAIYLHTGDADLAVAPYTTDGDLAIDPSRLRNVASPSATRSVTIPYAKALAGMVPPLAVRLRRDFGALLSLIRAHAILHQATRERDDRSRLVATLVLDERPRP